MYDTKLSSFEKAEHIIQICIYSEWLAEAHQDNELSENMYLILGSEKEKRFKINDYYEYYKKNKNKFVNFLKDEDLKKHYLRNVVFVRCVTGQIFMRKMAKRRSFKSNRQY